MATVTNHSYVEWGAIFAGSVLACAVSAVLLQFGGSIGLSVDETVRTIQADQQWHLIAVGAWLLFVQLLASMLGAYIGGRMRQPMQPASVTESEVRDGMHGLLVWATSTIAAVIAAGMMAFLTSLAAVHTDMAAANEVPEELARKAGIILGFSVAAGSLVSAIAAWWMGTVGGDHRDENQDFSRYLSFRKRK